MNKTSDWLSGNPSCWISGHIVCISWWDGSINQSGGSLRALFNNVPNPAIGVSLLVNYGSNNIRFMINNNTTNLYSILGTQYGWGSSPASVPAFTWVYISAYPASSY